MPIEAKLATEHAADVYIGMFIVLLDTIWSQSGPLTQFALGDFAGEGDADPFWGAIYHKYLIKKP